MFNQNMVISPSTIASFDVSVIRSNRRGIVYDDREKKESNVQSSIERVNMDTYMLIRFFLPTISEARRQRYSHPNIVLL